MSVLNNLSYATRANIIVTGKIFFISKVWFMFLSQCRCTKVHHLIILLVSLEIVILTAYFFYYHIVIA